MRASIGLLLFFAVTATAAVRGDAQEVRRYQPATPTVSPYLSLDRFNTGGLPNYYTLVRPLNRQRQVNQSTQRLQRQQGVELRQLQRTFEQRQQLSPVATGVGSRFLTSGSRSVYRETLQYYPPVNLRR